MTRIGTLWGGLNQPQTKIILSIAALNELELDQPKWDFWNKPADYTSKFSYGKIPTFEGSDGFKLMEGATIARYVCSLGNKVNLLGSNAKEIALVDQWTHFTEHEIGVASYSFAMMIYGFAGPFNREALDKSSERIHRALTHVEAYLATCPSGYLVSDSVTLADFFLAGVVSGCARAPLGAAERAKYPLVFAHYAKVTEDDKLKQFWGTEDFVEVAATEPKPLPKPTS